MDRPDSSRQTTSRDDRSAADPLGRAMLAHHRGDPGRLRYRDGDAVRDGNVAAYYFSRPDAWEPETIAALECVADREPVLDVGCGAGKHLLWLADRGSRAVGVDASPGAVRTARERGCKAVVGDMFSLPVSANAVGSVLAMGTQLGLGGSFAGIRDLLGEFARVTAPDGCAVVDNYDPTVLDEEFFGYRPDPRDGIARRQFRLEFVRERDGDRVRVVGDPLEFLLCSPVRFREVAGDTPWRVDDVIRADGGAHYRAVLAKRGAAGSLE